MIKWGDLKSSGRSGGGAGSIRSNMNMEGTLIIVTILTTECFNIAFVLVRISSCHNSLQWQSSCLVENPFLNTFYYLRYFFFTNIIS